MPQFRPALIGLMLAALGASLTPIPADARSAQAAQEAEAPPKNDTLRPELARPLQAVHELLAGRRFKEAFDRVSEADAVSNKSVYESYFVERMRASVASAAGHHDLALKAFEAVLASGQLKQAEQLKFIQAAVNLHFRAGNYPKTISWLQRYAKEGGIDPKMRGLLIRAHFQNNDFASAMKELLSDLRADEKAGVPPTEEQMQLLANCANNLGDRATYQMALERLVEHYPKKEYWADLLARLSTRTSFAGRLALDLHRLRLTVGQTLTAEQVLEMAELALQAGFSGEARKLVERYFDDGLLGVGPDAARHKRLRDLANKAADEDLRNMEQTEKTLANSKDSTALVNLGYAYVSIGQFDRGIQLMEQGILSGGMKRPEDAKLHMAEAYAMANRIPTAIQMFETVGGTDGTGEIARLWAIHLKWGSRR